MLFFQKAGPSVAAQRVRFGTSAFTGSITQAQPQGKAGGDQWLRRHAWISPLQPRSN
jgi:hypothetical protein